MKILIIAQSLVDGMVIEQSLKKEPTFDITLQTNREQLLLDQLSSQQSFDFLLFVASKNIVDLQDRLPFLHQLFGCPVVLLNTSGLQVTPAPWLKVLENFPLNPTANTFSHQMQTLVQLLKNYQKDFHEEAKPAHHSSADTELRDETSLYNRNFELIAIGASTGGPQVLNYLFKGFPPDLPVPILVVQHMPANFVPLFIEWLNNESALKVELARNGQKPQAGHIYFAPGDQHMILTPQKKIAFIDAPPMHSVKPAVSYLFKSVAETIGPKAIGILLTGMGKDGAQELALMKEKGALTIAQDKQTSVVFGMPGVAVRLNAARLVLSPDQIVEKIRNIFNH